MARTCPQCGDTLPGEGWQGLCPRCLIRVSFGPEKGADPVATMPMPTPVSGRANVQRLGDYELIEEIGRGGMGVVYRARQVSLNRIVAVKTILTGPAADERAVVRFREEAEMLARLRHPHIVAIHEITQHSGQHLFSMEYVQGRSLAEWLRDGQGEGCGPGLNSDFPTMALLVQKVAKAIQYAHDQGILHRDLKPSNILLDVTGEPRVTDFGCAKRLTAQADITYTGHIVGSPQYFAPEQFSSDRGTIGPRTDVFGLGAVLYHLITGKPPRHGETLEAVMLRVIDATLVRPRHWRPEVPRDLETICLKCMEDEPSRRYGTARDVAEDLRRFAAGEPILARPVSRLERAWRWTCRHRGGAIAGLLILSLAAVALGLSLRPRVNPEYIPADAVLTSAFSMADGEFDPIEWDIDTVWTGTPGIASMTQNRTNGWPGECLEVVTGLRPNSEGFSFFSIPSQRYDPALAGELVHLNWEYYGFTITSIDTPTFYPLVIQDGRRYVALMAGVQVTFGGWTGQTIPRLAATDFQRMVGTTPRAAEHPDFSPAGASIRFGFAIHSHDLGKGHVNIFRIDNLRIEGRSLSAADFPWGDGEFAEREWITWIHPSVTNATQVANRSRRVGHPAPSLHVVTRLQTNAAIEGYYLSRRAVYAPAQQGALAGVDLLMEGSLPREAYGESINPTVSFVVAQGGRLFRRVANGDPIKFAKQNDGWQPIRTVGLTAKDFMLSTGPQQFDGSAHPDFSERGLPLRFGFTVFHDTYYRFADRRPFNAESFYDNFRVTVHRVTTNSTNPVPQP